MTTKIFNSSHIREPFTYSIPPLASGKADIKKQLTLSQKISAVAIFILFSPLLIVGGWIAFLAITAAFKNKNIKEYQSHQKKPMPSVAHILHCRNKAPHSNEKNILPKPRFLEPQQKNHARIEENALPIVFHAPVPPAPIPVRIEEDALPIVFHAPVPPAPVLVEALQETIPEGLLGKKITCEAAAHKINKHDRNFQMNEVVLVKRSDGLFQYVLFKKAMFGNGQFDAGDGLIFEKPLSAFHKLNTCQVQRIVTDETTSLSVGDDVELESDCLRTIQMKSTLAQFPNYHNGSNTLQINGLYYTPISSKTKNFTTQLTASCGSSLSREVLLLDPINSNLLNGHLREVIKMAVGHAGNETLILKNILTYVRNVIFPTHSDPNLTENVQNFVDQKKTSAMCVDVMGSRVPFIPIDEFISARLGVCRHHALVTAYFLEQLTKIQLPSHSKPLLSGTVQFMRDNVPGGAHAWVTYASSQGNIHIDTLWNILVNFSSVQGRRALEIAYGHETIERQMRKIA